VCRWGKVLPSNPDAFSHQAPVVGWPVWLAASRSPRSVLSGSFSLWKAGVLQAKPHQAWHKHVQQSDSHHFLSTSTILLLCQDCKDCRDIPTVLQSVVLCADLQQPLILRDLKRTHARNASYTGSTVLSFLEQSKAVRHAMSNSSSYISFRPSSNSPLGDRSHSFAIGQVQSFER